MTPRPENREPFFASLRFAREDVPSMDVFPFTIPAISELNAIDLHPAVTFVIGEKGSGKSTLIEAIAVRLGCSEQGGEMGRGFEMRAPDGGLHDYLRMKPSRFRVPGERFFMRDETVFDMATSLDELRLTDPSALDRYGNRSLNTRSHGEAFLAIVQNRMRKESFFVMDEPEAALSPTRQLTLLKEIDWLVRGGCQFVIATHSPILMSYPDASMYELSENGIAETSWKETEHYQITKSFLDHPEAFLRHLID